MQDQSAATILFIQLIVEHLITPVHIEAYFIASEYNFLSMSHWVM